MLLGAVSEPNPIKLTTIASFPVLPTPAFISQPRCSGYPYLRGLEKSGTPLLRTLWGPGEVSCVEKCPLSGVNSIAYLGHVAKCS